MIITRKHLSRRTILRGFGASLALPLLDGMVPALSALSQTAARGVRRMAVVYVPNGMMMPDWTPKGEGADIRVLADPRAARGLPRQAGRRQRARRQVRLAAGRRRSRRPRPRLGHLPDRRPCEEDRRQRHPGRHFDGPDCGPHARAGNAAGVARAGARIGRASRRMRCRLQLRLCQHHRVARSDDAAADGERSASGVRAAVRRRRHARMPPRGWRGSNGSEAFWIPWPTRSPVLRGGLGARDNVKLTEYLDAIRDVERRIQKAEVQSSRQLPVVEQPAGIPGTFEEHARLMFDLLLLAFQTDMTRVATFMLAREVSGRAYPEIGVPDSHHPVSHHQNDPDKLVKLSKINLFHAKQFAYFVERMAAAQDGDGSLLDHSMLLYGAGISDSNVHMHDNLPLVLVGGGCRPHQGRTPRPVSEGHTGHAISSSTCWISWAFPPIALATVPAGSSIYRTFSCRADLLGPPRRGAPKRCALLLRCKSRSSPSAALPRSTSTGFPAQRVRRAAS